MLSLFGLISDARTIDVLGNIIEPQIHDDDFLFQEFPLCIFLDNADQFIELDLQALHSDLKVFARKRGKNFPTLRVIFPMRLSSYNETMGSKIVQNPRQFESADPRDVISDRIIDEIFSEKFNKNRYEEREILYLSRLVELLIIMSDNHCDFSAMLFGIAGSNIRLAFKLSSDWLVSEALNPRVSTEQQIFSVRKDLARLIANNYAEHYVSSVLKIISSGIDDGSDTESIANTIELFYKCEISEASSIGSGLPITHVKRVNSAINLAKLTVTTRVPHPNVIDAIVLSKFRVLLRMGVDRAWLEELQTKVEKK